MRSLIAILADNLRRRPRSPGTACRATSAAGARQSQTCAARSPLRRPPTWPCPKRARYERTVDLVLVDVRVTDKSGNPIKGLKPEQFSITEENQTQKISSFEYNDIEGVERAHVTNPGPIVVPMGTLPPPKPEYVHAAVRDHRLIVLFFDLTSLQNDDLLRSQQAAQEIHSRGNIARRPGRSGHLWKSTHGSRPFHE